MVRKPKSEVELLGKGVALRGRHWRVPTPPEFHFFQQMQKVAEQI
jgi:hypothetical protein